MPKKHNIDEFRTCYLYRVSLKEDPSKDYVGVTYNVSRRWITHKSDSRHGRGSRFARALSKYGIDNFTWEVLGEYSTMRAAFKAEVDARNLGMGRYNLTGGGAGVPNLDPTVRELRTQKVRTALQKEETKRKRRESRRKFFEENPDKAEAAKARLRQLSRDPVLMAKRIQNQTAVSSTPEFRKRRSDQAKVYLNNPQTHQRMSQGQKRRLSDPEQRQIRSDRLKAFCADQEWFAARQAKITETKNRPESKEKVRSETSARWARVRELGFTNLTQLSEYDRTNPQTPSS